MVIAGKESKEHLIEVLKIMKDTLENNPQVKYNFKYNSYFIF